MEALDLLQKDGPFDVLITDIVMGGGMDGMDFALVFNQRSTQTRIIYSSSIPADALSTRSLPLANTHKQQKPKHHTKQNTSVEQALGIRQVLAVAEGTRPLSTEDVFITPSSPAPSG